MTQLSAEVSGHWLDALATALEARGGPLPALEALRVAGDESRVVAATVRTGLQKRLPLSTALVEAGMLSPNEGLALARAGAGQRPEGDHAQIADGPPHKAVVALLRVIARRRQLVGRRRMTILIGAAGPLAMIWVSAMATALPALVLGGGGGAPWLLPLACTGLVVAATRLLLPQGQSPRKLERMMMRLPVIEPMLTRPDEQGLILDVLGALTSARLDVERTLSVLEALCPEGANHDWVKRAIDHAAENLGTAPGALMEVAPGDEVISLVLVAGEVRSDGGRALSKHGVACMERTTQRGRMGTRWALYGVVIYLFFGGLSTVTSTFTQRYDNMLKLPNIDAGQLRQLEGLFNQLQP
ncbi:MAG: hypothetical protein ACE366_02450 [Bradymonadia bacterium]